MTSRTGWQATWRGGVYLLGALATAACTLLALPLLCHPVLARAWADWHRRRAGDLLQRPVAPRPREPGPIHKAFADPATRRDLRWLPVHLLVGGPLGLAALLCTGNVLVAVIAMAAWWAFPAADPVRLLIEVPVTGWGTALALGVLQLVVLVALAYAGFAPLARLHARICLALLAPSTVERLTDQVATLTRTRADVLDAHAAELRRIERDLHDGAQARLVGIAMRLAVAREVEPSDVRTMERLLREAHEATEDAMTDLRAVLRTVYPPILADRGLAGALATVAAGCGVPTQLTIGELPRAPAAIEAVAYFTVTEALANVVKHSRATHADVRVSRERDGLCVEVTDNGSGGADETRGTGLAGIRRRVLALDGRASLLSPSGGPTTIRVELPCGW